MFRRRRGHSGQGLVTKGESRMRWGVEAAELESSGKCFRVGSFGGP